MICASISNKSFSGIMQILGRVEMAEIRLDLCALSDDEITEIFSSDTPLIATCRISSLKGETADMLAVESSPGYHTDSQTAITPAQAERKLMLAIEAGARYADMEMDVPKSLASRIRKACHQWGTNLIRSYHDYNGTPDKDELVRIADSLRHAGADIIKIATTASSQEDVDRVLGLYRYYTPQSLVAFAMGEKGSDSRTGCLKAGAPFSYAACSVATAPGQMEYEDMYRRVYGDRKRVDSGILQMPSSKSYAQRAILAAALAEGKSLLKGYTPCGDSESAISLAGSLGAVVVRTPQLSGGCTSECQTLEIEGIGAQMNCLEKGDVSVGESGLLARLMLPLGCQLYEKGLTINGEGSLAVRTMDGVTKAMEAMGGNISGKCHGSGMTVPFTVQGPLRPGLITIDGSKTSQIVSGTVMALPLADRNSTVHVVNPKSIPYIYLTADILRKFGIKVRSEMYGGREILSQEWDKCTEIVLKIRKDQKYMPAQLTIEGDWSAAAAFLAAGAIFGRVQLSGLDTSSLQADLTMLDILMDAGASLSQIDEPTGLLTVQKSPLAAFGADLSNCPDLFPVVSVLCAFCEGKSTLCGVGRLRHKESDRAEGIMDMLSRLGVPASIKDDTMTVEGHSLDTRILNGNLLHGGSFTSNNDHRMVMALRLASLGTDKPVTIDNEDCTAKSFPTFLSTWNAMLGL